MAFQEVYKARMDDCETQHYTQQEGEMSCGIASCNELYDDLFGGQMDTVYIRRSLSPNKDKIQYQLISLSGTPKPNFGLPYKLTNYNTTTNPITLKLEI